MRTVRFNHRNGGAASAPLRSPPMTEPPGDSLLHSTMPLCATLQMHTVSANREGVSLSIDWSEAMCTSGGALHGGVLMALADSAGGYCAFLNLPEGAAGTST